MDLKWLGEGYQQALNKQSSIISFEDCIYALRWFVNGFKDAHLSVQFDKSLYIPQYRVCDIYNDNVLKQQIKKVYNI